MDWWQGNVAARAGKKSSTPSIGRHGTDRHVSHTKRFLH